MNKRKNLFIAFMMVLMTMIFSTSAFAAAKPKLSKSKATVKIGKTTTLTLKNVKKGTVKWSTSNKKVVSVKKKSRNKATIKALKAGTAKITAKYNKKKYVCKITVPKEKTKTDSSKITIKTQKDKTYLDSNGNYKKSLIKTVSDSEVEALSKTLAKKNSTGYYLTYGSIYTALKVGGDYYYVVCAAIPPMLYTVINGEKYYHQYKGLTKEELVGFTTPSPFYEEPSFALCAFIESTNHDVNLSINGEKTPTCTYKTTVFNTDGAKSSQERYEMYYNAYNTDSIVIHDSHQGWGCQCFPGSKVPAGTKYTISFSRKGLNYHINFIVKDAPKKGSDEYNFLYNKYAGCGLEMLK